MQKPSIFYGESIFEKNLGARALPHRLRAREDGLLIEKSTQEGQWDARFPRNDRLVGSFEPHVLLANLGNVDWRPMLICGLSSSTCRSMR